jgi:hypothetical protein
MASPGLWLLAVVVAVVVDSIVLVDPTKEPLEMLVLPTVVMGKEKVGATVLEVAVVVVVKMVAQVGQLTVATMEHILAKMEHLLYLAVVLRPADPMVGAIIAPVALEL